MAKRRGKAKARRKTQRKVNLINVAESLVIANVVTEGLFNADLMTFITGKVPSGNSKGYFPSNTDNLITLPELLGFDQNIMQMNPNAAPQYKSFSSVGAGEKIKQNVKANGLMMAGQLILIPIGFTAVTKITKKPRASANRLLGYTGIGVKV
jgi:hypothetical protein